MKNRTLFHGNHLEDIKTGPLVKEFKKSKDEFVIIVFAKTENQIVFLKSWNEWGDGIYRKPEIKYSRGFINAL